MDTKLDRIVAYDVGPKLKKSHQFSKKFFPFMNFSHLRIVPLILNRTTLRLLLLVKRKGTANINIFYVTLHEIHGSIW